MLVARMCAKLWDDWAADGCCKNVCEFVLTARMCEMTDLLMDAVRMCAYIYVSLCSRWDDLLMDAVRMCAYVYVSLCSQWDDLLMDAVRMCVYVYVGCEMIYSCSCQGCGHTFMWQQVVNQSINQLFSLWKKIRTENNHIFICCAWVLNTWPITFSWLVCIYCKVHKGLAQAGSQELNISMVVM